MNVLKQKNVNDDILKLFNTLKFDKNTIQLKGSFSLESQQYPSDIDLYTEIGKNKYTAETAYQILTNILTDIVNSTNLYFVELKLMTLDNKKKKIFLKSPYNFKIFSKYYKNIDYIKLDLLAYQDNKFIDVSIIYKFAWISMRGFPATEPRHATGYRRETNTKNMIKTLGDDVKEYVKDKNYYKALKRLFSIYRLEKDSKKMVLLTKVFNSHLGEQYQLLNNLEAISKFSSMYNTKQDKKRAISSLKDINKSMTGKSQRMEIHEINQIKKYIKAVKKELNKEAKPIYQMIK